MRNEELFTFKIKFFKQLTYSKGLSLYDIKCFLDLTSSNIQLIAPTQNNIGLSFASPSITFSGHHKLCTRLQSHQISSHVITAIKISLKSEKFNICWAGITNKLFHAHCLIYRQEKPMLHSAYASLNTRFPLANKLGIRKQPTK